MYRAFFDPDFSDNLNITHRNRNMLLLLRISLTGMRPLFKKMRSFYFDLFQTIVVKSCWESCVHHFTSHLIHYSNYYLYYLGNAMLLYPRPPPHPIFNVGIVHGVFHARQVTILFLKNPTLKRGRGLSLKCCFLPNTFVQDCRFNSTRERVRI